MLFRNRVALNSAGFSYPGERFDAQFLAALDLMRLPWGGLEKQAVGAWERLALACREWPGTTIISHEILAAASPEHVARALASLGEAEVHVVVSARDLVRQIPAEWQEHVKHRHTLRYSQFLQQIRQPARDGRVAAWFWNVQELPAILDRWTERIPPERVHVITVPPPGSPPELLWDRFVAAFGLDGVPLEATAARANPSLGVPETALIRAINQRFNALVEPADYRPLVRELLAHQTLSTRTGSPRLALPPEVHPWASDLSRRWTDELRERGYQVVGDLDDLLGAGVATDYADPDRPRPRAVVDAALDAIGALLQENARLRRSEAGLRATAGGSQAAPSHRRAAEAIVRGLRANAPGRKALAIYRRARGRSSRPA
ncbi:MAG: hypothetical protein ACRCYQ_09210 [Nocardioides sp.]